MKIGCKCRKKKQVVASLELVAARWEPVARNNEFVARNNEVVATNKARAAESLEQILSRQQKVKHVIMQTLEYAVANPVTSTKIKHVSRKVRNVLQQILPRWQKKKKKARAT